MPNRPARTVFLGEVMRNRPARTGFMDEVMRNRPARTGFLDEVLPICPACTVTHNLAAFSHGRSCYTISSSKGGKMMDDLELFGDESQRNLQRRYFRLWPYLKEYPRLSFVGRAIGIDDPGLDEIENLVGLTMELGFLAIMFIRTAVAEELRSALEEQGLKVGIWQQLISQEQTRSMCSALIASCHLPPGYEIERITVTTPPARLHSCQDLMQRCGVAPLPGCILRGQAMRAAAEMIVTAQDEVVATGVTVMRHNPNGPYGRAAHVGFLATAPSWRGQGFARLLLARAILTSYEEYAAEFVHTGVRADNVPSQKVCRKCGLEDCGMVYLGAVYPPMVAQFTR